MPEKGMYLKPYTTTEITEGTEDTEISTFLLQLSSANPAPVLNPDIRQGRLVSGISVLKIHFFNSLTTEYCQPITDN